MTWVTVDPGRPLGSVDRNVFGGFVEHLGRCVYGGIYEEGSRLADPRGFRGDVLGLLRELRMGSASLARRELREQLPLDGRHLGPRSIQGRGAPELAWGWYRVQPVRHGRLPRLLCRASGAAPYICLNMGTGTLAERSPGSSIATVPEDTEWARRR